MLKKYVIAIIFVGVFSLLVYVLYTNQDKPVENNEQDQAPQKSVIIDDEFENKIVYGQQSDIDKIKEDCRQRGGEFKECGSPCGPGAEFCVEVCAYTCEFGVEESEEKQPEKATKDDKIIVDNPLPDQEISSPLTITGRARGTWFFEGNFPVILTDWDGVIIAESYATAQGDWMTEDFVEFSAELSFDKPELYDNASIILQKANPSGLPENDDALEYTINFE